MRMARVWNGTRNSLLGESVRVADRFWPRLRGLLLRPRLEPGQGLALVPCKAVHMWGVRYPIDVAFMDAGDRVVAVHPELAPWRRTPFHRPARWALELPAGTLAATGTTVGDEVSLRDPQNLSPEPSLSS